MNQILDPASEMEAEMAGAATACLVAALDHSKAKAVKLTIEVEGEGGGEPPVLLLPPRALRFFADVLRQMAKRPVSGVATRCPSLLGRRRYLQRKVVAAHP